jgi:hypothetical protein
MRSLDERWIFGSASAEPFDAIGPPIVRATWLHLLQE